MVQNDLLSSCLKGINLKQRRYVAVTLVIKRCDEVLCFTLCGSQNPSQKHSNDGAIGELWNILCSKFGEIWSWFVKFPDEDKNENLRFAVSKKNFCLLDSTCEMLHEYKFRMVKCDVSFNNDEDMLELKVYTDNNIGGENPEFSRLSSVIHLRTTGRFAEDIQKLMVERTTSFEENLDSTENSQIFSWIIAESPDSTPPLPCYSQDHFVALPPPPPHQQPPKCSLKFKFNINDFESPPRIHKKTSLFRSESTVCITDNSAYSKWNHRNIFYENIFHYDDSTYTYRVYINEPNLRPHRPRMKVRIDRWNRLSDELKEIDQEALRRHGLWFDNQYRHRSSDDSYKKICNLPLNINLYDQPRPTGRCSSSSSSSAEEDHTKDYWKSDLCLTIQRVMEGRVPKMWDVFNITHNQYLELSMKLDLRTNAPRARDWTEFAEWIGIKSSSDMEIIQHFCYTRKMVIMDVVFCHWYFMWERRRCVPACNYDMLKCVLYSMERFDLIHGIQRNKIDIYEDEESDEDNTHF
ncbi:uncharacterized protein LOC134245801 [Saccostrea cucullata]|uniref:uncharacterized protein LOC134245801 n=1 Tax=Saccostrea cuccullata TaxID=36930 RepID=UPI002ED4A902